MQIQTIRYKLSCLLKDKNVKRLIIVGLILRLLFALLFFSIIKYPDTYEYYRLASNILDFNLNGYTGERTLGYPLLLAIFFNKLPLVAIFQLFLGILTWIVWYKTLLKLKFSSKSAFIFVLIFGSFLHSFMYEVSILVESLALFVISCIFYLLSDNYLGKTDKKKDYLMALLLGYIILIKPFYAFFPFVIYGFSVSKDFSFKKIFSHKIIILITGLFVYFGCSYINKINTGYFVSTTYFGLNTAQNCVYFAENTTEEYKSLGQLYGLCREKAIQENKDVAMSVWYGINDLQKETGIVYFPDFSAYLGEYAKATIALNKEEYIKQVITVSWVNFWDIELHLDYLPFDNVVSEAIFKSIWEVQYAVLLIFKILFVLLLPFYLFKAIKDRKITFELITVTIIFSASVLQAIVTFGNNSRFSFPFEYLMIIVVLIFSKSVYTKYLKKN